MAIKEKINLFSFEKKNLQEFKSSDSIDSIFITIDQIKKTEENQQKKKITILTQE